MKNFLKLHKNKILSGGLLFLAALMALTGLYVWNLEHKPELQISFFKNAALNFLFPDKSFEGQVLKNVHDSALISELDFEGKKILFMSDAEKNLERYLLQKGALEDIDVLKVGHHGSKTSSTADFLKIVKPEYAVISASDRNRYGHPHPDVLSRLSAIGAQIFRTDINGTIILNINNGRLTLQKEK